MQRSETYRRVNEVQARLAAGAEQNMHKIKIQFESASEQLKIRKKSILIWLRSGFSFYYLKFFGK
jgi:hypothetical protein